MRRGKLWVDVLHIPVLNICVFNYSSGAFEYTIELPNALKYNASANILVETVQTHATYPWPDTAAQTDPQSLKWTGELFVLSPYQTLVQRTKIRYVL